MSLKKTHGKGGVGGPRNGPRPKLGALFLNHVHEILAYYVEQRKQYQLHCTRTMVIWLYNDALGYARLLVQNEVS